MSRFLLERERDPGCFDNKYLRDIILNFVIAGRDSTAGTLVWFLYVLCSNEAVQDRIAEEVRAAATGDRDVGAQELAASLTEDAIGKDAVPARRADGDPPALPRRARRELILNSATSWIAGFTPHGRTAGRTHRVGDDFVAGAAPVVGCEVLLLGRHVAGRLRCQRRGHGALPAVPHGQDGVPVGRGRRGVQAGEVAQRRRRCLRPRELLQIHGFPGETFHSECP